MAAPARETIEGAPSLDVRSIDGTVVRLEPEEPTQPKMPRHVVFHEQGPEKPRGAESSTWGQSQRFSVKWIAAICVGIAAMVITPLVLLPNINRSTTTTTHSHREPSAPVAEPDAIDDLITRSDEAMRIFKAFATAPEADNFLAMVRDRSAVEPLIRSSHHTVEVPRHWAPEDKAKWQIHQNEQQPFAQLKGTMPDYSHFSAYFVMEDQQLLFDWKATTGYGTATFDELARRQGNPAEIRGLISPSGHYSPVFPESKFQSYLLESPNGEKAIWCYTRRGETVDEEIGKIITGGAILKSSLEAHKVTLRLEQASEDALPNQWLIEELLHKDWITP